LATPPKNNVGTWWHVAAAAVLTLAIYWICLRFLFPGYFAPLSPFHMDFYEYAGAAYKDFLRLLLHYPRPAAYAAMKLLGAWGLNHLMAGGVLIALANVVLTIRLFGSTTGTTPRILPISAAAYLVLLFAHPDFYFEHRHDLPAELSYLFLVVSLLAWIAFARGPASRAMRVLPICAAVVFAVLFAFAKETYFVSAALLVFAMAVTDRPRRNRHLTFLAILALCEAASVLWTRHVRGPFVNMEAGTASSYHVSLSPASLLHTGGFYVAHLFNPAILLLCVLALWVAAQRREWLILSIAWMLAGLAALAPHAMLPNHQFEEYAWAAAPLLLAPLLLLDQPGGSRRSIAIRLAGLAVLTVLAIAGPGGYTSNYGNETLTWMVGQERKSAALNRSLSVLAEAPRPSRILVAGLEDFTAVPWHNPDYIRLTFGTDRFWTILVEPSVQLRRSSRWLRFVEPSEVRLTDFDYVASYQEDGNLTSFRDGRTLMATTPPDEVLVPELTPLESGAQAHPMESYRWLKCADTAIDWGLWTKAAEFLDKAQAAGASGDATFQRLSATVRNRPTAPAPVHAIFEARPARIVQPDRSGIAVAELYWKVPDGFSVEVHVSAPDGQLLAASEGPGQARTEKWVTNGMRFFLQDVRGGKPLTAENTLGSVTVEVTP
jgi:hypothetical protein